MLVGTAVGVYFLWAMARNAITSDFFERLVEAFREAPGNVQRASKYVKCDRRTARRGWNEGWPDRAFPPISQILAEEREATAARLANERKEELASLKAASKLTAPATAALAAKDAVDSRTIDTQVVRGARSNALGLLAVTQRMLKGAVKFGSRLESEIGDAQLKPREMVSLLKEISSIARSANETAKIAIAMERQLLGEPDRVIRHEFIPMSVEEATREIEMASRSLKRLQDQGIIDATPTPANELAAAAE